MRKWKGNIWLLGNLIFWLGLVWPVAVEGQEPAAKIKITGYGLFGNFTLKRMLTLLEAGGQKRSILDANYVEDSVAILISRVNQDGYLHPEITATMTTVGGRTVSFTWRKPNEEPLPRPLHITRLEFKIRRGTRYYYKSIQFEGLILIPSKTVESYFMQTGTLLPLKAYRIYSPQRLKRGLSSVVEVFERRGYRDVQATAPQIVLDDRTGQVTVLVKVEPGIQSVVRSVREEIIRPETESPAVVTLAPQVPFSTIWEQDFAQGLKTNYYRFGFPDATVQLSPRSQESLSNLTLVDLEAQIATGPKIWLGDVRFEGQEKTKTSVMRRRVRLASGSALDPIRVERGRYRLSQLGIFDSVGLRYEKVNEHTRDAVFTVKESRKIEASLFFGFGTYELLRGGFEVDQHNIFGRAHNARLRVAQSFKSTSADYTYTMPELLGENLNVFLDASALRRQEISFLREEYGGGGGAEKYLRTISSDVSVRYDIRLLTATETTIDASDGLRRARAGAFIFDLKHDRRDNPLYPRRGYKVFSNFEVASEYLGGEVDYERVDLAGSYHFGVGSGRWLHLGLSHGFVFTAGDPQFDLPFNRRFFPGGENSVRGYTQGEAAPRNAQGTLVGAETYLLGSVEFEQALTPKLSFVAFVDSVGIARRIRDYPFGETLSSVGGGLAWRTLIGPVRLEYGYNVNPRLQDPSGTIQFSVGFPF